jgi:hypothetical protein
VILLAKHDETTTLAAKKKRQPGASSWPTSTPKKRVWGFGNAPSGRPVVEPQLSWETATGSVQFTYENASGRAEWLSRDPLSEDDGANIYDYVANNPANSFDPLGLCKVEIRCGVVAFGYRHCGVYVNGVEYGLGGDGDMPDRPNANGSSYNGSTLFGKNGGIPKPYANPAPAKAEPGITTYSATSTTSCDAIAKCFQNYQKTVTPPRYAAISGPNSNTYLHNMLNACLCKFDVAPPNPKAGRRGNPLSGPADAPNWNWP